jgi:hypothetical protein
LLDIIDNDTNATNKAIAKLLLKKLKYVYDTKVNNTEESSYVDSINIKEANSFLFLQELLYLSLKLVLTSSKSKSFVLSFFICSDYIKSMYK